MKNKYHEEFNQKIKKQKILNNIDNSDMIIGCIFDTNSTYVIIDNKCFQITKNNDPIELENNKFLEIQKNIKNRMILTNKNIKVFINNNEKFTRPCAFEYPDTVNVFWDKLISHCRGYLSSTKDINQVKAVYFNYFKIENFDLTSLQYKQYTKPEKPFIETEQKTYCEKQLVETQQQKIFYPVYIDAEINEEEVDDNKDNVKLYLSDGNHRLLAFSLENNNEYIPAVICDYGRIVDPINGGNMGDIKAIEHLINALLKTVFE